MTCVWDALKSKIRADDLNRVLGVPAPSARQFVLGLKSKNRATVGVKWQGKELTRREMEENMKWIEAHDVNTIGNGYDCSCADPYIMLVCHLFNIRIIHQYLNTPIVYDPPGASRYELHFSNNHGHFW